MFLLLGYRNLVQQQTAWVVGDARCLLVDGELLLAHAGGMPLASLESCQNLCIGVTP